MFQSRLPQGLVVAIKQIIGSLLCLLCAAQTCLAIGAQPAPDTERAGLLAQEERLEAAYLAGDAATIAAILREDFHFSHGSGNRAGREQTIASFGRPGKFIARRLSSLDIELHGNSALSQGRIEVAPSKGANYTVCYLRLYARSDAASPWLLVSHRTYREANHWAEDCAPR